MALINLFHHHLNKHKRFILYSIIGVSGVILDLLLFVFLSNVLNLDVKIATAISVTVGITNNFLFNTRLNFKVKDKILLRFLSFYSVGLVGLGISELMLIILSDILKFDPNFVKILSIFVIVFVQYNLNKFISFKETKNVKK